MRIEVGDCSECPMLRMLACTATKFPRDIPQVSSHRPPAWCPLRTGDVTVGLKREVKDD